ncbi:Rmf/CrpP fold protein [Streptomyces sioyaensis]|uniref:Rmf/CrpP fold protein n=1 Tax=Streptomyces sioyaensis TaxID=67364 RepID=UPI0036E27E43
MGPRESITQALTEGAAAGRAGKPATDCPYPRTSLLRTAWIRGYARARPLSTQPETAE